jgi:hypothetical protein
MSADQAPSAPNSDRHAAPSEGPQDTASQWVSVAETATRLNTTSRSIQRQCQSGKLRARRIEGKRGEVWEVEASELRQVDQKERDGDTEGDRSATTTATQKSATATSATPKPSVALFSPDSRLKSATGERDSATNQGDSDSDTKERDSDGDTARSVALELQRTRDDLERERQERMRDAEQIQFLRAMVEGVQQSEAQTKAALREALKAMPKALTAGDERAPNLHTESAQITSPTLHQATHSNALEIGPQTQKGAALKKEPRPLWKVILGIR